MRTLAHSIAVATLCAGTAACDTTPRGRDAAVSGQRLSEVAIRFEVVGDAVPSVSLLAYRATVSGVGTEDVLPIVDPLTAVAPEGGCSPRDVAGAARAVGAVGGKVELEAFAGWHLDLGQGRAPLAPSPRVYPDLGAVVGGVVTEVGPIDLRGSLEDDGAWPQGLALVDSAGARLAFAPPARLHLLGPDGAALPANTSLVASGDLVLGLEGAGQTPAFVELRPFGASWALACPAARDKVVVPAADVARLADLRVPVSIEAVARESRSLSLAGAPVRLTLETRSSSVVELRP